MNSPELDSAIENAIQALVAYIKELLPLLTTSTPNPVTPLQQRVFGDLDWLLPFRQHAPEVQSAFEESRMLHRNNIDSPGAIASLWCWRGIFYRTRFSKEHAEKLLFPDYDSWISLYNTLCEDEQIQKYNQGKNRYFANANVFGTATNRSISNAEAYFNGQDAWHACFEGKPPGWKMTFKDAYQFTQRTGSKGRKILLQLGELTGMLITADLVYAGKVAMPTPQQMGEFVGYLGRGALSCFKHFHLAGLEKQPNTDIAIIFCRLYDSVQNHLTPAEREAITYDPVMFEHMLCKYQRYYDVYDTISLFPLALHV